MTAQDRFDDRSRMVAAAQPDDLRRWTEECGHLCKIRVERHESKSLDLRMFPDRAIVCCLQPEQSRLARSRKKVDELSSKFEAQVLVEQELHLAAIARRSRSA